MALRPAAAGEERGAASQAANRVYTLVIAAKILPSGGGEADAVRGRVAVSGGGEEARRDGAGEDSKEVCMPKEPSICKEPHMTLTKRPADIRIPQATKEESPYLIITVLQVCW